MKDGPLQRRKRVRIIQLFKICWLIWSSSIFTLSIPENIFELLAKSEVFDHFMGKKFPQVKRYGLEGAESMMVALDSLFRSSNAGTLTLFLHSMCYGELSAIKFANQLYFLSFYLSLIHQVE